MLRGIAFVFVRLLALYMVVQSGLSLFETATFIAYSDNFIVGDTYSLLSPLFAIIIAIVMFLLAGRISSFICKGGGEVEASPQDHAALTSAGIYLITVYFLFSGVIDVLPAVVEHVVATLAPERAEPEMLGPAWGHYYVTHSAWVVGVSKISIALLLFLFRGRLMVAAPKVQST